jgi:hypothetical protein
MRTRFFYSFIIVCLALSVADISAQVEKQVTGAKGEGILAGRVSESEARAEALSKAKVEALRKAGITESLNSYQMLFKSEANNNFSEFFSSDVQTEIQGAVKNYTIVSERRKSYDHYFAIEVTIDATVVMYDTRPDPGFSIRIDGIKPIYNSGENLEFSIMSTKDCYLHIFNIAQDYAALMYPNFFEKEKLIQSGVKAKFPFGFNQYELSKDGKEPEFNRLVFVFTKQPIKYLHIDGDDQVTSSEKIFSWVYGMTPDKRIVQYQTFTIR